MSVPTFFNTDNIHQKTFSILIEILCQKMKYSANIAKIQPFLAENNIKAKHLQVTKMAGVFSRFSIKIIYIKINYFACDLHNCFMYKINH